MSGRQEVRVSPPPPGVAVLACGCGRVAHVQWVDGGGEGAADEGVGSIVCGSCTRAGSGRKTRRPRRRVLPAGQYSTEPIGLLAEHLDWMRRSGRSDRTLAGRRIELTRLAEWLGHDPATATAAELEQWQAAMSSTNSMRWRPSMVRPYYKWLRAKGVRPDDPAALLPIPRRPRRLPHPIPEPALLGAVAAAPARLRPWLLLGGWSGLRAAEVAGLDVTAFSTDVDGQTSVRVVGKGDAERVVPVPGWAWAQIAPGLPASGPCWRRERAPASAPVTGKHVSMRCNRYLAQRADVPRGCTFHSLRHRFATQLLAVTKDVRLVQHAMGHADLSVLHVYTQVLSSAAAAAVDALPGPPAVPAPTE